jgi:hypothetical protein
MFDDGSRPLKNPRWEQFALMLAQRECSAAEAYRQAVSRRCSDKTSHVEACKLSKHSAVSMRLRWLARRAEEKAREKAERAAMSIAEKRIFLARVVRTPVAQLTKSDVLCGEWSEQTDHRGTIIRVRMPDKLRAIQLDNELADGSEQAKLGTAVEALAKLMGVTR